MLIYPHTLSDTFKKKSALQMEIFSPFSDLEKMNFREKTWKAQTNVSSDVVHVLINNKSQDGGLIGK